MKRNQIHILLLALVLCCAGCGSLSAQTKKAQDNMLEMSRALQVFSDALAGVTNLYVDTVDVQDISTYGINAMLSRLDPYTTYIPETETADFNFMTTGEYGGIGAYIQQVDSVVYVQYPMPGSPAEESGLRTGDAFLAINGKRMIPATASEVSNALKGPIGTDVSVRIQRLGEESPREVTLTRKNVVVDQVVYRGMLDGDIGYMRLSSFTDKSAADVRRAYGELSKSGDMKGLILDLRSNGGGVLDGAIDILSMFLPKGTEVLSTKGRQPQTRESYTTTDQPISTTIPLVVLINSGSASASEILAGALQDMDRAVLVGSKSFGKGLVQSTRPAGNQGILKVTISRYYIPSGRCIQQLDYSHRNPDGSVAAVPDSLTNVFYTKNGRPVRDGGGIRPDIEVEDETLSALVYTMLAEGRIFKFARELAQKKAKPAHLSDLVITDEDLEDFLVHLEAEDFKYGERSKQALDQLKTLAEFEGYKGQSKEEFEALAKALTPSLRKDIEPHREQVKSLLRGALAVHYFGMQGQYAINLETDPTLKEALAVLNNPERMEKILQPEKKQ